MHRRSIGRLWVLYPLAVPVAGRTTGGMQMHIIDAGLTHTWVDAAVHGQSGKHLYSCHDIQPQLVYDRQTIQH